MAANPQQGAWGHAYMPDPTDKGILGAFDATDIIEEIRHNLKRHRLVEKDGKREWIEPTQKYKTFQKEKKLILKEFHDDFQLFLNDITIRGGEYISETNEIVTYKDVDGIEIKPLVNEHGENDICNLLNAFLNRNIYLSSFPGRKQDMFVYRMTNKFGHDLVNLLAINAKKYEIQEPKHIGVINWIIIVNVFAALQTPVESGGRKTLEKIMGEKKQIMEQIVQAPGQQ